MISRRDLLKTCGGLLASVNLPSAWLDQPVAEEQEIPCKESEDEYKIYMFSGKHSGRRQMDAQYHELFQLQFTGEGITRCSLLGIHGPILQFACGPHQLAGWVAMPDCAIFNFKAVQMQVESDNEWKFAAIAKRIKDANLPVS